MRTLQPAAKVGLVTVSLVIAVGIACLAVIVRQHVTRGPDAQASAGMYAAGDAMLGMVVFGLLALVPLSLSLYWLRADARFWSVLAWSGVVYALTGAWALGVNLWASQPLAGWPLLLSHLRIGLMPLSALALLTSAFFAPHLRHRWMLLAAVLTDVGIFAGIVFVKLILPRFIG